MVISLTDNIEIISIDIFETEIDINYDSNIYNCTYA